VTGALRPPGANFAAPRGKIPLTSLTVSLTDATVRSSWVEGGGRGGNYVYNVMREEGPDTHGGRAPVRRTETGGTQPPQCIQAEERTGFETGTAPRSMIIPRTNAEQS